MIQTHVQSGYDILKRSTFHGPWPISSSSTMSGWTVPDIPRVCPVTQLCWRPESSVADVFETIGSHRPYRPSLGIQKAINELDENSGRLYDADVVAACLELVNEQGYRLDGPKKAAGRVTTQMQSL
jgi:putative two-component system response regulator